MKIVINATFGGFSISRKAAEFMAARGNERAAKEIAEYESSPERKEREGRFGGWYGYGYVDGQDGGYERTDPDLVAAVEALGEKANGSCATLRVVEIPDGVEWEIDEYDGSETVHEKHRSWP